MKKILIIRSGPYQVDPNAYNLQELGLAAAFIKNGYQCDVMYYHKRKSFNEVIQKENIEINVLWRHGIRLLRSGIYPDILRNEIKGTYDYIICSEYSQIMSVLVCQKAKVPVFVYNGPYYNLFKIPFIEPIYDAMFCRMLNEKAKKVFCKTEMAKNYIAQKGIINSIVVGVGLDTSKFDQETSVAKETEELLAKMKGYRNLLYVGQIIKRKNVELLIKAFALLKENKEMANLQLVLVGKGDEAYTKYCENLIPAEIKNDVIWCRFIKNAQMKFVYHNADVFLLPSVQEIFGMVLLEAMYFETPVISSHSAGAGTLIKSGKNGIIVEEFDEHKWAQAILSLLEDPGKTEQLGKEAGATIRNEFMWNGIAKKMLREIEHE